MNKFKALKIKKLGHFLEFLVNINSVVGGHYSSPSSFNMNWAPIPLQSHHIPVSPGTSSWSSNTFLSGWSLPLALHAFPLYCPLGINSADTFSGSSHPVLCSHGTPFPSFTAHITVCNYSFISVSGVCLDQTRESSFLSLTVLSPEFSTVFVEEMKPHLALRLGHHEMKVRVGCYDEEGDDALCPQVACLCRTCVCDSWWAGWLDLALATCLPELQTQPRHCSWFCIFSHFPHPTDDHILAMLPAHLSWSLPALLKWRPSSSPASKIASLQPYLSFNFLHCRQVSFSKVQIWITRYISFLGLFKQSTMHWEV